MKVRDLIRALAQQDLDLEVVIPADPDLLEDFMIVSGVEQAVFAIDRHDPGNLVLAELHDEGARIAVRLYARPE